MADQLTPDARSRLMSRVKTQDTAPELALRRALWSAGVRGWRLHVRDVIGRPDLIWRKNKLAVFVDGAFWHGHPGYYRGQSGPFWDEKIARNRRRDTEVNEQLAHQGWQIIRFWDFEIESEVKDCVTRVCEALEKTVDTRTNVRPSIRVGG